MGYQRLDTGICHVLEITHFEKKQLQKKIDVNGLYVG